MAQLTFTLNIIYWELNCQRAHTMQDISSTYRPLLMDMKIHNGTTCKQRVKKSIRDETVFRQWAF